MNCAANCVNQLIQFGTVLINCVTTDQIYGQNRTSWYGNHKALSLNRRLTSDFVGLLCVFVAASDEAATKTAKPLKGGVMIHH